MKKIAILVLMLAVFVGPALFGQVLLECIGDSCHCGGPEPMGLDYAYLMTVISSNDMIVELVVGTDDPDMGNYTNFIMPSGWTVTIVGAPVPHNGFTMKGGISNPTGTCYYALRFTGSTPVTGQAVFGFNHKGAPHDVAWAATLANSTVIVSANWAENVGMGKGPVHGPKIFDDIP